MMEKENEGQNYISDCFFILIIMNQERLKKTGV